jgi:hypothetical protein
MPSTATVPRRFRDKKMDWCEFRFIHEQTLNKYFPDRLQDLPGRRERRRAERAVFLLPTQRRKPQMRR